MTIKTEHRKEPFDLLEAADAWGWLPLSKLRGTPFVTRIHGAMFFFDVEMKRMTGDPLIYWLERHSLARADALVAVSNYVAREEMALSKKPDTPVTIIYNAVDTDFFKPSSTSNIDRGLIVFVNSIQYRKGVYELCKAMNILAPAYPDARVVFIGRLDHRPAEARPFSEELLDLVQPEFRDRVQFLGWLPTRSEVLDYLQKAHVCCYPSRLETFGIAPAEAMSVGKPTVYSNGGPGPELIEQGGSGLLCDSSDPADIAAKIKMVFDDDLLAEKLGRNARERIVRLFNKRDWLKRNVAFYESCLRRNS
jgi:glycosyltransferase involved in cell wall biosynthesis